MRIGYARVSKADGSQALDPRPQAELQQLMAPASGPQASAPGGPTPPAHTLTRQMTIRMVLIVAVVLAMLTGGCFRATPTSTGVLDRSLDPDLWPWTVETVQVECWGDGTTEQAHLFSVLVEGRRMVPAQVMSGWHAELAAVRVDLPEPLYAEARRICGAAVQNSTDARRGTRHHERPVVNIVVSTR